MSYAGTGTIKESWQQAQNLINQQTQIIISELVETERQLAAAKLGRQNAERALESYKANPDAFSEGWYVKELGKERERRQVLESELRRQTEFGKLKDRAKMKVERVRDIALRENKNLKNINDLLRSKSINFEGMKAANERQAIAWQQSQETNDRLRAEIRTVREENQRLLDVLKLGRQGLQAEQW